MHQAPSVNYPVGRSSWAAAVLIVASASGHAAALAWWVQSPSPGFRHLALLLVSAGLTTWAARDWFTTPSGVLSWEAGHWRVDGVMEGKGQVQVCLDAQRVMVVRWHADTGASAWFWLERGRSPEHWSDLRRAVYSRANSDALAAAEPPAANP